jgi:predicted nucleic acid-binding protein
VADRELAAVTSTEVVQEIVHRYLSIGRPDLAIGLASRTMDTFAPVLPITHALMRRVPTLADRYPALAARDLVHLATCIHEGIGEIVTTDRGFDRVREIRRIDPMALGA